MQLKKLRATQEKLLWPQDTDLPVISWESCTLFGSSIDPD